MGQEGLTPLIHLPAGPMAVLAVGQRATFPQSMRVAMGVHLTPEENTEAPMVSPTNLNLGALIWLCVRRYISTTDDRVGVWSFKW